jgi:hypothetical protein
MTPPETIIIQKVDEWELRRQFNDPGFHSDLMRRTCQKVETYCELAPPSAGQVDGAMSHVHDWYEYVEDTNTARLLATVHFYKNPDGTIGASGKLDPQMLVIGNTLLVDP